MPTINNYSVSLSMDASSYIRDSSLSRKETDALKREINAARTPADKYERSVNLLGKALKEGAIDQGTYNRLLDASQDKYKNATKAAVSHIGTVKKMAAAYLTVATASKALAGIREQMQEIDAAAKSARSIGESYADLERFSFAAGEFAGLDGPEATAMLGKLTQRIGESAIGAGEASKWFQRLNLDVGLLSQRSPVEQFEALADAIKLVENPTERVAIATKLFEESGSKLLPLLMASRGAYEESALQVERMGLALSDIDASKVEAANDAMGRAGLAVEGLYTQIAIELTPAIYDIADGIKAWHEPLKEAAQLIEPLVVGLGGVGAITDDLRTFLFEGRGFKGINDMLPAFNQFRQDRIDRGMDFGFGPKPHLKRPGLSAAVEPSPEIQEATKQANANGMPGFVAGMKGALEQVGMGIIQSNWQTTNELIKATKEDPAIKSLEVGTQEAYEYLTTTTQRQAAAQAENEKRAAELQKKAVEIGERGNMLLNEMISTFKENGFKRLR